MAADMGADEDELYISGSQGQITNTAPSANGDVVRVVGYCLDSTNGQIWFNPSSDWIEVSVVSPIDNINGIAFSTAVNKVDGVSRTNISSINGVSVPASGPSLITNLVQHLDAGDTNSYSGSGSTWYDLTSNNVDGTFRGPRTCSSDGGGSFSFDGVDDGIKFDYDDAAPIRLGEDSGELNYVGSSTSVRTYGDLDDDGGITVQAWIKPVVNGSTIRPFMIFGNNNSVTTSEASFNRYKYYQGIEFDAGGAGQLIVFAFSGHGGNQSSRRRDRRTANGVLDSYGGSWVNVAFTMNDDTGSTLDDNIKIYVQGSEVSQRAWSAYNEGTGPGLGYRAKFSGSQAAKYHAGIGLRRGGFLQGLCQK